MGVGELDFYSLCERMLAITQYAEIEAQKAQYKTIIDDALEKWFISGMIKLFFCITIISLCGCSYRIDNASKQYRQASSYVNLGDSKEKVLKILSPSQAGLTASEGKSPEKFMKKVKILLKFTL